VRLSGGVVDRRTNWSGAAWGPAEKWTGAKGSPAGRHTDPIKTRRGLDKLHSPTGQKPQG